VLAVNLATTAITTYSASTTAEQNLWVQQVYKLNIKNTFLLTKNHFIKQPPLIRSFPTLLMPDRCAFRSHVVFPGVFCQNVVQRSKIFVNLAAVKDLTVDFFVDLKCEGTNFQSRLLRFGCSICGFSAWECLILDPVCNLDVLFTFGNQVVEYFMLLAILSVVFVLLLSNLNHHIRLHAQ
jgi:hypothetical protein